MIKLQGSYYRNVPTDSMGNDRADHTVTQTLGRSPLDKGSGGNRNLYITTQNTQKRQDIHARGESQPRNPSKPAATDPSFRPRGHRDRRDKYYLTELFF
jgi:hypothetical protein